MADKDKAESTESTPADDAARSPESPETDATAESTTLPPELADEPPPEADASGTDDRVPEPVGVGSARAGSSSTRGRAGDPDSRTDRGAGKTPEKKGRATAKRDTADKPRRTGPVAFVKESVAELRKVVYPTGPQLVNYFIVVLIFVLFVIAYVSLLDLGLGAAMFRIFA